MDWSSPRSALKRIRGGAPRITLALAIAAVMAPAAGYAQAVQVVPSQQKPIAPSAPQTPAAQMPHPELSPAPLNPGNLGSNTREIPLPNVFRGCWFGQVSNVDSMRPLSPDAGHIRWLTKAYTLCYRQTGYNGRWQLTFAEGSVANRAIVSDQRQVMRVKSVEGPNRAVILSYLHFRAPQVNPFGMPTGVVNTLDELTHLHCTVSPDDGAMEVAADVFVENDGKPWVEMTWRARFIRIGNRPGG